MTLAEPSQSGRVPSCKAKEDIMLRGALLWLIGIPIPVIIILWLLGYLH
ncbi:hypothetical protein GCM10007880_34250 [Mesorhizobium amorphae]|uniref:Uncharacterized protein n=1 Tax=Mesorhizobium amorphae CCNWGS0123 TaxID=1082933 RepID=G6Y7W0_9HYPH|nr:hypothetical protein MEA186_10130 [Mesorhizobium amorphae CCNWGS0123]GLR42909.1 hypothetical protein GCM10007880_34250 [Mesorhizobium amorphae]